MPLTRDTVTRASRIMLPTYVALFLILGLNYGLTAKPRLLNSPGLAYAEDLFTLRAWGLLFVATAAVMATALLARRRTLYRFALWVGIVTMVLWAAVLIAAVARGEASPTAWCWPAFVAVCCYASNQSLLVGEA